MRYLFLALALLVAPAHAQDYPARTVEIVVPFAAGGGTDLIARVLAERLSESLKQRFVIINRPGASTNIGTAAVANAAPDGYTLLLTSISFAANPSLYRKLSYRADRLRAGRADREFAEHSRRHSLAAGEDRRRAHRAPQGAARRAELCLLRRGQRAASRRRAAAGHHRQRRCSTFPTAAAVPRPSRCCAARCRCCSPGASRSGR